MKHRLRQPAGSYRSVLAAVGLAGLLGLVSLTAAACETEVDSTSTATIRTGAYTTVSTPPASVPALGTGITPEQVLKLVEAGSAVPSGDWEMRDYQNIGDWAVANLYTGRLSEQMDERGVTAVFEKRGDAWFQAGWVSVSDPSNQWIVELRNMGAPPEVWRYFGLEPALPDAASTTSTTELFPAVDKMLGELRLDVSPREGVRVAVGGLREIPSENLDSRKRLIEGEIIIENRSGTEFAYGPDDFRLYVGPFQTQIEGSTASTDFPVQDAILTPVSVEGHAFMTEGNVSPGKVLHGYLLTWIADRGTESSGLEYDPSDPNAGGRSYMNRIQP